MPHYDMKCLCGYKRTYRASINTGPIKRMCPECYNWMKQQPMVKFIGDFPGEVLKRRPGGGK